MYNYMVNSVYTIKSYFTKYSWCSSTYTISMQINIIIQHVIIKRFAKLIENRKTHYPRNKNVIDKNKHIAGND